MSRILVIHGTGGPSRSEESLRLEWITSMQDGLALAGHHPRDLDVAFVNLDPYPGGTPAAGPSEREAELAGHWWRAARFAGERPAPAHGGEAALAHGGEAAPADAGEIPLAHTGEIPLAHTGGAAPADAAALLGVLNRSRFFTGIPGEELLITLRVLRSLLFQDALGRAATARVTAALTPDVEIVIGHALGAVPAVHALGAAATHQVSTLVTVGVPAGMRTVAPPAVTRWINVIDAGDTLASRDTPASGEGPDWATPVAEVWLECDPRLRAPRNYLASPEFGTVLAAVLLPAP